MQENMQIKDIVRTAMYPLLAEVSLDIEQMNDKEWPTISRSMKDMAGQTISISNLIHNSVITPVYDSYEDYYSWLPKWLTNIRPRPDDEEDF